MEQLEHDTKRRRVFSIDVDNGYEMFDYVVPSSSTVFDSTVSQLTGNFSLAMDLWDEAMVSDVPPTTDNDSAFDLILVEVTDEEMNKFWDTLPKEFGGLM